MRVPLRGSGAEGLPIRRVTLSLTNVPLIEALRYLHQNSLGLKYKIEPYAVSIVPDH